MADSTTDLTKYRILAGFDKDDSTHDEPILIFLNQAENKVAKTRYPFGYDDAQKETALIVYSDNVEQIFTYLWNKQGAEGEISNSHNGISRSYEKAGVPDSFVSDIVPFAKTI
jgi:hypothetical protein